MKKTVNYLNKKGMTLVEMLVALALFAMLTMVFAPFFAQQYSLLVQAGLLNEQVLDDAHELERGLAEGRVTPDVRQVPVKYVNEAYAKAPVRGWLITEGELSTFVSYDAFISNGPFALSEGYGPKTKDGDTTGQFHHILIRGNDTHFKKSSTEFKVYDKNGTLIAGAGTFADVVSTSVAYIKIRTAGQGILTSEGSPYTIEIITPQVYQDLDGSLQDEVLQVQLFLGLPFYLAAGEKGQVLTSSEPSYWINDTGFPSTPNHLYASIYKNGMYLVGGQNGVIYYRTGEKAWTQATTDGTSKTIRGFAYNVDSNIFVAVGDGGMIARSLDGYVWTSINSGTTKNLTGVAYGNGTFIAIGQDGVTLRSPDGLTWTQGPTINYGNDLTDITFKYNKFIAVGKPKQETTLRRFHVFYSYVWHTGDGSSWQSKEVYSQDIMSTSPSPITFESIGWNDSYFIIGQSNGKFRYSADLREKEWWLFTFSWSETETGVNTPIRDIAYYNGTFFAVTDNGKLVYSNTGITNWTVSPIGSKTLHTISTW